MSNYLEKFEKMRIAGSLASKTLDMITDYVKEGTATNHIDKLCYEFIRDNGGYSAPQFYRGFENQFVLHLIMLFVTVYLVTEHFKMEILLI